MKWECFYFHLAMCNLNLIGKACSTFNLLLCQCSDNKNYCSNYVFLNMKTNICILPKSYAHKWKM